ncbi:inverse autotransporter beta domain-containing protein [bacterium]|nr:inverse autotransporter beta domain-containing protein [bacterium]
MRIIIKLNIIFILLTSISFADDSLNISKKLSDFISERLPGEGYTETSIDLRENNKPDFSILAVRELEKNDNGNFFTQFSLFNTEKNNDERIVGNLGFGKRSLSDDKFMMTGFNAFLDYDDEGNARGSLGIEAKNAVLEFYSNYYSGIDNATDEKVLDGYDLSLASQIPYLHWATAFVNSYKWDGIDRDDIEGTKLGSEIFLSSTFSLEVAHDDKDKSGLEDEWYAKLQFFYPPREGATLQEGISESIWREEKDMSRKLLSKVKRQNKIMIEFKGSSRITRAD